MSEPNAAPHPDGEELPRDSHADEPDAQDVEPADAPEPPDEPTTSGDADDTDALLRALPSILPVTVVAHADGSHEIISK